MSLDLRSQKQANLSVPSPKGLAYKVLQDEGSYASTILVAVAQVIPLDDMSQMSFDALILDIQEELKTDLSESVNGLKLQAICNVLFNPTMFYEDVVGFIDICNVLSGEDIDPDVFDPADPFEMAWAIAEARLVDPPDENENRWSDEVRQYMGLSLLEFGVPRPPANMTMAIMPESINPAMLMADQPDMLAAAYEIQSITTESINQAVQEQLAELRDQLAPFKQQE